MAVGNHVAEIARQGVWASLTGGWCYEPTHGPFCNTVHLYVWAVLLLWPLLLGVCAAGAPAPLLLGAYAGFVLALFGAQKLATAYLHRLFDRTEPMIAMKCRKAAAAAAAAAAATADGNGAADSHTFRSRASSFSTTRRETSQPDGGAMMEMVDLSGRDAHEPANAAQNSMSLICEDGCSSSSSSCSAGSGDNSGNALLNHKKEHNTLMLPTDSLELIIPRSFSRQVRSCSTVVRKMSEPSFGLMVLRTDRFGRDYRTQIRRGQIRRVRSTSDTNDLPKRRSSAHRSRQLVYSDVALLSDGQPVNYYQSMETIRRSDHAADQPCCSKTLEARAAAPSAAFEAGGAEGGAAAVPPAASAAGPLLPGTALHRTLERIGGADRLPELRAEGDLKVQITRFLEELIDKHPETLDAIENVRMNRLGRPPAPFDKADVDQPHSISEQSAPALQLGLRQGTHVAYDHEDTTEGAVHSFQDEQGNWWTYAFDEQGTGTAHALGSSTAIAELFDRRRSRDSMRGLGGSTRRAAGRRSGQSPGHRHSGGRRPAAAQPQRSQSLGRAEPAPAPPPLSSSASFAELDNLSAASSVAAPPQRRAAHLEEEDSDAEDKVLARPTTVFHPAGHHHHHAHYRQPSAAHSDEPTSTASAHPNRPFISFVNLASRLYSNQIQRNLPTPRERASVGSAAAAGGPGWSGAAAHTFQPGMSQQSRMALEAFALESRRRLQVDSGERFQWHDYVRLDNELAALDNSSSPNRRHTHSYAILNVPPRTRSQRQQPTKLNYYYMLRIFPKWLPFFDPNGYKLQLNRLALTALFDRNRSLTSCVFDVALAVLVAIVAFMVISRNIFSEISLFLFAFVVAGSQFSLLKSVQPDAASPIHGFNWLVCYSRPAYFILFAGAVLLVDLRLGAMQSVYASPSRLHGFGFLWSPRRPEHRTLEAGLVVGRDLLAAGLLLQPLMFTLGLLPQVNTLAMHVLEQCEMHLFGGTATFSLGSALFAVARSAANVAAVAGLGLWVQWAGPATTQSMHMAIFVAATSSLAYVASRLSNNPYFFQLLWRYFCTCKSRCLRRNDQRTEGRVSYHAAGGAQPEHSVFFEVDTKRRESERRDQGEPEDPLPQEILASLTLRASHDCFVVVVNSLLMFALHSTSIFTAAQPYFEAVASALCLLFGIANHYVYPQMRSHTPWKLFSRPLLRSFEYNQFETTVQARLMRFERVHVWMVRAEQYLLYPLLLTSQLTTQGWLYGSAPLTALCLWRLFRQAYACPQLLYVPLAATQLLARLDWPDAAHYERSLLRRLLPQPPPALLLLYAAAALWPKAQELVLKLNFIMVYVAPWQISWGSAFHAFAQPFSVPHTAFLTSQALLSSIISAPLNPLLGSSIFLLSYVRPVRFWERDYNTRRIDNSNLRLISQLERGPMIDDSSLNSIFYEHLTRSLQRSLAGDLALGRWASSVEPGDCFILVSLYLSCMVHIIEVGNGFVTFQVRGLEFRGTYCHQREAEAISEDWADVGGCCCCTLGNLPGLLSYNSACALRWLAWEVTSSKYVIDGYSITDNSAVNLLQVHELRRLLVTLYVKCIVFYCVRARDLPTWLAQPTIRATLDPITANARYCDADPIFCAANDEDFDLNLMAVSRAKFLERYEAWIRHCHAQREKSDGEHTIDLDVLKAFCFALSILGRRALGAAAYNRHANAAESFLYGLHSLFKGDMRVGSSADEWVLVDPEILTSVISPAVRMALKLHQDHFAAVDDFDDYELFYQRIQHYQENIFISHEHDPAWRQAIIANTPSLLALRHMYDESQDDYKVIMLNKMHLNMRVIKLNRECVRAFWSGQQQELIFLRNRNPERGSIQNARQVLRNMINSSADQPIGYPIYVSPLTTSFAERHPQLAGALGPPLTFCRIGRRLRGLWRVLRHHFGTSGSSNMPSQPSNARRPQPRVGVPSTELRRATLGSAALDPAGQLDAEAQTSSSTFATRFADNVSHSLSLHNNGEPSNTPTDILHRRCKSDATSNLPHLPDLSWRMSAKRPERHAIITDRDSVETRLNEPLRSTGEYLVHWPRDEWRAKGGQSAWPDDFALYDGQQGAVVHEWLPCHPNRELRSHTSHVICLLRVPHKSGHVYVPIKADALRISAESSESMLMQTETNI